MTLARAVQDDAFNKCCMRTGSYDGSRRNYFFPRLENHRVRTGHEQPRAYRMIGKCMYLRFVVADIDEDSERALGVFHAVRCLRAAGKLHSYEETRYVTASQSRPL